MSGQMSLFTGSYDQPVTNLPLVRPHTPAKAHTVELHKPESHKRAELLGDIVEHLMAGRNIRVDHDILWDNGEEAKQTKYSLQHKPFLLASGPNVTYKKRVPGIDEDGGYKIPTTKTSNLFTLDQCIKGAKLYGQHAEGFDVEVEGARARVTVPPRDHREKHSEIVFGSLPYEKQIGTGMHVWQHMQPGLHGCKVKEPDARGRRWFDAHEVAAYIAVGMHRRKQDHRSQFLREGPVFLPSQELVDFIDTVNTNLRIKKGGRFGVPNEAHRERLIHAFMRSGRNGIWDGKTPFTSYTWDNKPRH